MICTQASMIFTTGVVTAVIELRLIDTASETAGCLSSPIEYTIENPTNRMQVEEWITSKLTPTTMMAMAIQGCHEAMTKQCCGLGKPATGNQNHRRKQNSLRRIKSTGASRLFEYLHYLLMMNSTPLATV
jgi:hypothetical protein